MPSQPYIYIAVYVFWDTFEVQNAETTKYKMKAWADEQDHKTLMQLQFYRTNPPGYVQKIKEINYEDLSPRRKK